MSSSLYKLASVADGFLCLFIFFPLAILHWRGTWGLQDVYFFPNNLEYSVWCSFIIGSVGCVSLQMCQPYLFSRITPNHPTRYYMVSRLYLYTSGWFVMCYWRGVWDTLDFYLTEEWINSVVLYVFCTIITLVTKTSRNSVGLPFSVAFDHDEELLKTDTVLKMKPSEPLKYFGDVCFTQFIIVTCGICVWRGVWNIYDAFFFPHDILLSDLMSLGLGYLLCMQLFMLQWPAGITSSRLDEYPVVYKIMFEDVVMLAATWANLLLWRGAWDLCVAYVIPDPVVGGWISHWVGTVSLILLQTFNTVSLNAMEIDGEYKNGEGLYPTSYLRTLFKDSLSIKKPERQYLIESADRTHSPYNSGLASDEFETSVYNAIVSNTQREECKQNGGYHETESIA